MALEDLARRKYVSKAKPRRKIKIKLRSYKKIVGKKRKTRISEHKLPEAPRGANITKFW